MPGKLIVGTIETQNINFDSDTTGMTIGSTGIVAAPNKPAFQVSNDNAGWTAVSDGTIIPFNDKSSGNNFDNGGNFNISSYRFVAPVTGDYQFNVFVYSFNTDNVNAFRMYKNGSALYGVGTGAYDFQGGENTALDATISGSIIISLSATDYVDLRSTGGSDYYGTHSHFSGHLIG
tara:strand:- start:84 stop:611 length:528 start_codon:yes stop_codon:yes gene_type:complete